MMTVQYCCYSCDAFFSIPFLSWHYPYTGESIPPTLDPTLWSTFFEMLGDPPGGWDLTGPAVPFSPEPGHFLGALLYPMHVVDHILQISMTPMPGPIQESLVSVCALQPVHHFSRGIL